MSTETLRTAKYTDSEVIYPAEFSGKAVDAVLSIIIGELFKGGPNDGNKGTIKLTEDLGGAAFTTWSPRRDSYAHKRTSTNRLYWDVTLQATWRTSVQLRGIESVEGHPILFARRLSTTRWETFEVVTLKRGAGFTATILRGFVFRLGPTCHFHADRKAGERRFKKAVRTQALAVLNNEQPDEGFPPEVPF